MVDFPFISILIRHLALLAVIHILCVSAKPSFRQTPTDITKVEGESARLKCHFNDLGTNRATWFISNGSVNEIITSGSTVLRYGYNLAGQSDIGEYDLLLNRLTVDMDGVYQCQTLDLIAIATVTVQVPGSSPKIANNVNGRMNTKLGDTDFNLTCTSRGGKPATELTWYKGGVELAEGFEVKQIPTGKTFTTISVLHVEPHKEDNQVKYECKAQNAAMPSPLITSTVLNVQSVNQPSVAPTTTLSPVALTTTLSLVALATTCLF